MNGAECLVGTLINHAFTNPGTSEVGLVAEIAKTDQIRAVPILFEGIAAGAADGYLRMTGRPAATMLRVGPGLANAWSALHNAGKADSGTRNMHRRSRPLCNPWTLCLRLAKLYVSLNELL